MNDPVLYAKVNSISRYLADNFTKEYEDELGEMSGRCIDIGSGPADVVVDFFLPKLDPKATIVCADISDAMVEFGEEKYKDNQRMSYIKLDIETRDLPKDLIEQFDHVTSFYCLHWCQDLRQVFENFFNLLRPGGTTLLTFIAKYPGMNSYKKLEAMPRYQPYVKDADRWIPVFQHSDQPQKILKALIKDVGFEVLHCSVRERSYTFDNADLFAKFKLSVNPFAECIPAHLKKEYEQDLAREFAKECIVFNKNNNNEREYSVHCSFHTLVAYFRKPITGRYPN